MLDMSFLEEMKSWINKEGLVFDEPRIDELRYYPASPIAVQTSNLFSRDKSKLLEFLAMVMTRADLRLFLKERSSCSRTYLDTSCVKPL